jgi:RNA polymerase sigma factor (sigma-70 family)
MRRYLREVMAHLPGTDRETEHVLAILPDRTRVIIILHDLEGLRVEEVAAWLDVTPMAVRRYLHRARTLMRHQLYGDLRGA